MVCRIYSPRNGNRRQFHCGTLFLNVVYFIFELSREDLRDAAEAEHNNALCSANPLLQHGYFRAPGGAFHRTPPGPPAAPSRPNSPRRCPGDPPARPGMGDWRREGSGRPGRAEPTPRPGPRLVWRLPRDFWGEFTRSHEAKPQPRRRSVPAPPPQPPGWPRRAGMGCGGGGSECGGGVDTGEAPPAVGPAARGSRPPSARPGGSPPQQRGTGPALLLGGSRPAPGGCSPPPQSPSLPALRSPRAPRPPGTKPPPRPALPTRAPGPHPLPPSSPPRRGLPMPHRPGGAGRGAHLRVPAAAEARRAPGLALGSRAGGDGAAAPPPRSPPRPRLPPPRWCDARGYLRSDTSNPAPPGARPCAASIGSPGERGGGA